MTFRQLVTTFFVVSGCCLALVAIILFFVINGNVPSFEELENPKQDLATRIISSDGEVLDYFFIERRTYLPYDSIPKEFIDALISTEDREFYNHWGVHSSRAVKAIFKNIFMGKREGASTITQQLARKLFLDQSPTLRRKILEAFTAIKIEQTYTKNEILELYSNTVCFGRGAYGLQVASQLFFAKRPTELTVAECAYMVALLKNPVGYDVQNNYERAIGRRNLVLHMMYEHGKLSAEKYLEAIEQPISMPTKKNQSRLGIAPHFVEMVRQTLEKDEQGEYGTKGYDLYRDGLIIHTTLNAKVQRYANSAVEEHLAQFQQQFDKTWKWVNNKEVLGSLLSAAIRGRADYIAAETEDEKRLISDKCKKDKAFIDSVKRRSSLIQTGVVVLNPASGAVLGMVGASPQSMRMTPEARYSLNHAVQIKRQPGSSFKPFVYASALEDGLSPTSTIESGPFSYTLPSGEVWSPSGSSSEGGLLPLSSALKFSINSVAARLITEHTTPEHVAKLARKCGITTPLDPYPTLALGAEEVKPIEIIAAYGTFLNQGIYVPPFFITKIEDRMGNVIYERKKSKKITDAMHQRTAQTMVRMMEGVVNGGTASSIRQFYKYAAAGKTGTTNDYADAWFIGFTPQLVAGVWTGFDSQRIKFQGWYGQGGRAAAPIFGRMMKKIYDDGTLGYKQRTFNFGVPMDSTNTAINWSEPPPEGSVPQPSQDSTQTVDSVPLPRMPRLN